MSTNNKPQIAEMRIKISLTPEEREQLDIYRHNNRIKTISGAARRALLERVYEDNKMKDGIILAICFRNDYTVFDCIFFVGLD